MLQPEHTGSVADGFPTKKAQLEQSQAGPGCGPPEIICSWVANAHSSTERGPTYAMRFLDAKRDTRPKIFSVRLIWAKAEPVRPLCERVFVGEAERAAAEAEVARRSRVMAGLDEAGGASLEASIVEAMQRLRAAAGADPETAPDGGGEA